MVVVSGNYNDIDLYWNTHCLAPDAALVILVLTLAVKSGWHKFMLHLVGVSFATRHRVYLTINGGWCTFRAETRYMLQPGGQSCCKS